MSVPVSPVERLADVIDAAGDVPAILTPQFRRRIAEHLVAGPLADPSFLLQLPALVAAKDVIEAAQTWAGREGFKRPAGTSKDLYKAVARFEGRAE